jgi:ABC-type cobalamin/Fe3+-siderophores transport system ATPase subunit
MPEINKLPKLFLPESNNTGKMVEIPHNGSVVIVGANGSGKSRLGVNIESNAPSGTIVHRLSAQKALDIPEYAQVKSLEQSQNDLLYGHESSAYANPGNKMGHRWGNRPETFMLNDYAKVLSTLFAMSSDRDRKHAEETRLKKKYIPVPDAPIDILLRLWGEIFPHRSIKLIDGAVKVSNPTNTSEYLGKEMSDGERVGLYMMGQCLCAPPGTILVIDEPEIHLHTSIMQSMWNKLEEAKKDCLFVYITHDLNFASTRVTSTSVWVKEYDGANKWVWEIVPELDVFPESLMLELLGNRKEVVFVEGEKGGKDHAIYQAIYKNYNVVPRNGCELVIQSARAFRINATFHHLKAFGLIDRDYRSEAEINGLARSGTYCLSVAEIENVLLNETILRLVSTNQKLDPNNVVDKATDSLRTQLSSELDRQASLRTCRTIEEKLYQLDTKAIGIAEIKKSVSNAAGSIDIDKIYNENMKLYTDLSTSGSLDDILKYYNNKGLVSSISAIFELGKNGYEKLVLRMLNSSERDSIIQGLKQYLPTEIPIG